MLDLCWVIKALTKSLKSFKVTKQATDSLLWHWSLVILNTYYVPWIIIENAYWLFATAKGIWGIFFSLQYEGSTIRIWKSFWSGFLRDILHCHSPRMGSGYVRLKIWKLKIWLAYMCVYLIWYPIKYPTQKKTSTHPTLVRICHEGKETSI